MSKEFRQLFIMIANVKGTAIPLAFGYLPDKKEMSYYLFIYMLIDALGRQSESIMKITGRSTCYLKLKSLTCDFELSIHKGIYIFFFLKIQIICSLQTFSNPWLLLSLVPEPLAPSSDSWDGPFLLPQQKVSCFCKVCSCKILNYFS